MMMSGSLFIMIMFIMINMIMKMKSDPQKKSPSIPLRSAKACDTTVLHRIGTLAASDATWISKPKKPFTFKKPRFPSR